MPLKKDTFVPRPAGSSAISLEPCSLSKLYPTVVEFLSSATWEDGTSRETGTITLLTHEGQLKAAVNDRGSSTSAFVSARSLTALLKAIEAGLAQGTLEFRAKPSYVAKAAKKGG